MGGGEGIDRDQRVLRRSAGHRKNLAVVELVFRVRGLLKGEVFGERVPRARGGRQDGHRGRIYHGRHPASVTGRAMIWRISCWNKGRRFQSARVWRSMWSVAAIELVEWPATRRA